jgi:hypothetical protein
MALRPPEKPPANYWATIVSGGSLVVALLAFLATANKTNAEETRRLEQRLCRLEAFAAAGECKR